MDEERWARIEVMLRRIERLLDKFEPYLERLLANPFLKIGRR